MWQHVGVVRDGKALQTVVPQLRELQSQLPTSGDRRAHEAANILEAGLLIARSALAREESRGAHYRLDHPLRRRRQVPEAFCRSRRQHQLPIGG